MSAKLPHLALAGLMLVACGGGGDPSATAAADPERDRQAIDRVYQRFSAAYDSLDPDALADLYTEDALYLSPQGDVAQGREEIRARFARSFDRTRENRQQVAIAFSFVDRGIDRDLAYDVGHFLLVRTVDGAEVSRSRGKFAVVLERGADGAWRFQVDAYSDAPLPDTAAGADG